MKRIIWAFAAVGLIVAAARAIPSKSYEIRPVATVETYQRGSPAMETWLTALKNHEGCPPEGIIDSNGTSSYGPFCYQAQTFAMYKQQFAPTSAAPIADPAFQRWLTLQVVSQVPGGWRNWQNSVYKMGGPSKIPSSTETSL